MSGSEGAQFKGDYNVKLTSKILIGSLAVLSGSTALATVAQTVASRNAPPVVRARVQRISTTIEQTLPRLRDIGLGSYDGFSVMTTATDYLPEALDAYLRLPRQWADTRPIEGYKTALMILVEQLDLLAATMDKIFDAANREDANALITHGRFLEAKFGHGSSSTLTARRPPAGNRR